MRVLIVLVSTFEADEDDDLGLIPAINGGQLGEMLSFALCLCIYVISCFKS